MFYLLTLRFPHRRSFSVDSFVPLLVSLLDAEHNPDAMLLAARALTHLADVLPPARASIVHHGALPGFCARLLTIEYIDLAEQSLQALEKLSQEHGAACILAGGLTAVLTYLDFFSIGLQRVAVATAAHMCRQLPAETHDRVLEAAPQLTQLLHSEDAKVMEHTALALSRAASAFAPSPDKIAALCAPELLERALRLISAAGHATPLTAATHSALISLLGAACRGCPGAAEKLLSLGAAGTVAAALRAAGAATPGASPAGLLASPEQLLGAVALLNDMLPPVPEAAAAPAAAAAGGPAASPPPSAGRGGGRGSGPRRSRGGADASPGDVAPPPARAAAETHAERMVRDRPELVAAMCADLFAPLVQLVGATGSAALRLRALSALNRMLYHARAEALAGLVKPADVAGFIAGLLTSKDAALTSLTLQVADVLLDKVPDCSRAFLKEGAVAAITALAVAPPTPAPGSASPAPAPAGPPAEGAAPPGARPPAAAAGASRAAAARAALATRAASIRDRHFGGLSAGALATGVTEDLVKLRALCAKLAAAPAGGDDAPLRELLAALVAAGGVSTFEFLESGAVGALKAYLAAETAPPKQREATQAARLRALASLTGAASGSSSTSPLSALLRKLLEALGAAEAFPLLLSGSGGGARGEGGEAGMAGLSRPFKLCLRRDPADRALRDYATNVVLVEPLATMSAIEEFLLPRVRRAEAPTRAAPPPPGAAPAAPGDAPAPAAEPAAPAASPPPDAAPDAAATAAAQAAGEEAAGGGDEDMGEERVEEEYDEEEAYDEEDMEDGEAVPQQEEVHDVDLAAAASQPAAAAAAAAAEPPAAPPAAPPRAGSFAAAAAAAAAAGAGGSAARTSAAAVVAQPQLQFAMGGIRLQASTTILQAVHRALAAERASAAALNDEDERTFGSGHLWEKVHTLTYRSAAGDDDAAGPATGPGAASGSASGDAAAAAAPGAFLEPLAPLAPLLAGSLPFGAGLWGAAGGAPGAAHDIILLLSLLHGLARVAPLLAPPAEQAGPSRAAPSAPLFAPDEFVSAKLTAKLARQLQDVLVLCSSALPEWCTALPAGAPFLFPFETRRQLFYATALGLSRALARLQASGAAGEAGRDLRVGRLQRQKVRVSRNRVLDSAAKVFTLAGANKMVLEVEFFNEVGTGTGPTLEFYTLLSREFQRRALRIWRADAAPPAAPPAAAGDDADDVVHSRHGLFPTPLAPDATPSAVAHAVEHFKLLGRVVAKAIQDGRMLDLPLSPAFYRAALGHALSAADVASFDPDLGASVAALAALGSRAAALKAAGDTAALDALTLRDAPIDQLCLNFTLPGAPQYLLRPGGDACFVAPGNVDEYAAAVVDGLVGCGVARQFAAFRTGFDEVFPLSALRLFSEAELDTMLCGCGETWSVDMLTDAIKFDHGYTASSPPVQALLGVLSDFSAEQQRAFLRFVTGAPRLPPGGLAALQPRLTIVCKHPAVAPGAAGAGLSTSAGRAGLAMGTTAADGDLPSAMTCANYIKLPPYSCRPVLRERLLYAITEGTGSFLLS
jgi:E3 ubiquitin-protein ligase TRIP12